MIHSTTSINGPNLSQSSPMSEPEQIMYSTVSHVTCTDTANYFNLVTETQSSGDWFSLHHQCF